MFRPSTPPSLLRSHRVTLLALPPWAVCGDSQNKFEAKCSWLQFITPCPVQPEPPCSHIQSECSPLCLFCIGFWQNPKAALVSGPTSSSVSSFILHLSAFARFSLCCPLPYPQDVFVKDFYQANTPITFLHTEFLDSTCCPKWGFKMGHLILYNHLFLCPFSWLFNMAFFQLRKLWTMSP